MVAESSNRVAFLLDLILWLLSIHAGLGYAFSRLLVLKSQGSTFAHL